MGRPRKVFQPRDICIPIERDDHAQLIRAAAERNVSLNDLIRGLIIWATGEGGPLAQKPNSPNSPNSPVSDPSGAPMHVPVEVSPEDRVASPGGSDHQRVTHAPSGDQITSGDHSTRHIPYNRGSW